MYHPPMPPTGYQKPSGAIDFDLRSRVKELEISLKRLQIVNAAMWELLRDALKATDADLEARIKEVDLRDGIEDGKISSVPLRCPSCNRVSTSKHWRCLYCGLDFEQNVFT
jgi:hypothetical protein